MTAPASEQVSGGLAFATPGDWFPVRIPTGQVDADLLTGQILAARPALPRDAVARLVRSLVDACASLDVLCAYTTALEVPGGPLPATVIGQRAPRRGAWTSSSSPSACPAECSRPASTSLPAGRTARIERLREAAGTAVGPRRNARLLVVHYVTAIPRHRRRRRGLHLLHPGPRPRA